MVSMVLETGICFAPYLHCYIMWCTWLFKGLKASLGDICHYAQGQERGIRRTDRLIHGALWEQYPTDWS